MWRGAMWSGLLAWAHDDPDVQRQLLLRRAAHRRIRRMLAADRLASLTMPQFVEQICAHGAVRDRTGTPLGPDALGQIAPGALSEMLQRGDLTVVGNQIRSCRPRLDPVCLPGFEGQREDRLQRSLSRLLHGGDPAATIRAIGEDDLLTPGCASVLLAMYEPREWPVWGSEQIAGLRRLAMLVGAGSRWAGAAHSYEEFTDAAHQLKAASGGVLEDMLALDLLLCRLAALRRPRVWKIAVAMGREHDEAEEIAHRCLEEGFVAIDPDSPDDANISRLRQVAIGDCVMLHLPGRIGAIGRVTRPYYEINRDQGGERWWRRLGVEWIEGDRDYGSLLAGAHQRFSVIDLEWETFWAIARMYRHDPDWDRLFRLLRGAWVLPLEAERLATLAGINRPLPLRDQFRVELDSEAPEPGDLAFLYREDDRSFAGVARVIGADRPCIPGEGARIDVLLEQMAGDGVPLAEIAESDHRIAGWRPPQGACIGRLDAAAAAAVSERMGVEPTRHFVLRTGARDPGSSRPMALFHLGPDASGQRADLLAAARAPAGARCLVYHGPPDNSFSGFGRAIDCVGLPEEPSGTVELRLDLRRFTRRPGGSTSYLPAPHGSSEGAGRHDYVRTVLAISAADFYRVIAAGMGPDDAAGKHGDPERSIAQLAEQIGAPVDSLQQMERLLLERGQMILYGPPGTGKTWLAQRLARYLTDGDPSRAALVQFHPSYAYEDFVQGLRPRAVRQADGATGVEYPVVPGVFMDFCQCARRDPDRTWVFVIDEISRAHVSRVFGELMMALEYRGQEVELAAVRPDGTRRSLAVPENVLVIGTMNTADRSTTSVDFALRRRFVFYPLFPDDRELVLPIFRCWLERNAPGARWVAELLTVINERIEPDVGRDLLIGPSYFMRPDLSEERVREIWRFELEPLLQEYFAAAPDRLRSLSIDDLIWQARSGAGLEPAETSHEDAPSLQGNS